MRKIILLLILASHAFSFEVQREVLERDDSGKLKVVTKALKNLKSKTHFSGEYFKVVLGTSNEPIKMDDSTISKKAANVYYHLEKGREFFKTIGKEQELKEVVIRLEIQNEFHGTFHFSNPHINPIHNNATTTDAGEAEPDFGVEAWGNEIWFRPVKKIALSKETKKQFKKTIRASIPKSTSINEDVLIYTAADVLLASDKEQALATSAEELLTNYARDAAIRWLVPELSALLIRGKYFYDAAFIPEIIYHEYTHLIMSDYLPPVVNNTLLEGIADFFASKIANSPLLAHKLGEYGNMLQKRNALSTQLYEETLDGEKGLGTDFVLSLLYEIDKEVTRLEGQDPLFFAKTIYEMRKSLTVDSTIAFDLPELMLMYFPRFHRNINTILLHRGI